MVNFQHPMLSFSNIPVLKKVYEEYRQSILNEGYEMVKQLPYPYRNRIVEKKKKGWRKFFKL